MKKERIVIASLLKPVDDTRMLEKIGMTLAALGTYEVFIIGYPSHGRPDAGAIHFLPSSPFQRMSLARLLAPIKIFKKIYQIKPATLIVNTHELLFVALCMRILFGSRIVYDIRENHYRNILHSGVYPKIFAPILAAWVRGKEKLTSPFFHAFLLAEQGYAKEMNFFGDKAIVIENKAKVNSAIKRTKEAGKINLLFSGTIAESTGIFEAIRLTIKLHSVDSSVRLRIIGYCAKSQTLRKINSEIAALPFISIEGGDRLVPHPEIVKAILSSDFGVIYYPSSPHTENSIPTKLYEYLANHLPILVQRHQPWMDLCDPLQACLPVDFHDVKPAELLAKMHSFTFYSTLPLGVTWESEGQKLLAFLSKIKSV